LMSLPRPVGSRERVPVKVERPEPGDLGPDAAAGRTLTAPGGPAGTAGRLDLPGRNLVRFRVFWVGFPVPAPDVGGKRRGPLDPRHVEKISRA
jgi:hypothetical protein